LPSDYNATVVDTDASQSQQDLEDAAIEAKMKEREQQDADIFGK
jgi:hypothetical protein